MSVPPARPPDPHTHTDHRPPHHITGRLTVVLYTNFLLFVYSCDNRYIYRYVVYAKHVYTREPEWSSRPVVVVVRTHMHRLLSLVARSVPHTHAHVCLCVRTKHVVRFTHTRYPLTHKPPRAQNAEQVTRRNWHHPFRVMTEAVLHLNSSTSSSFL